MYYDRLSFILSHPIEDKISEKPLWMGLQGTYVYGIFYLIISKILRSCYLRTSIKKYWITPILLKLIFNCYFPVIVNFLPASTVTTALPVRRTLLQLNIEFISGLLGAPPLMSTSVSLSGTTPQLQFPAVFQDVLTLPVHTASNLRTVIGL